MTLPPQDHKRAVAKHIKDKHPSYTPKSLFALRAKTFKKPAVAAMLKKRYDKGRAQTFKTHTVVRVEGPERNARGERGDLYYCKKCLFLLNRSKNGKYTCAQNLKRRKTKTVLSQQRRMWVALRTNAPLQAKNFAQAVEKSFAEIDALCGVNSS